MNHQIDNCCSKCRSKIRDVILSSFKSINNEYGKSSLDYRFSKYIEFKQRMLGRLNQYPSLSLLNAKKNDDLAMAVIDAVATIGDVLTFYQERIANECFLRTCTERKSIIEFANTVGYLPRPGAAASVELVFTVEDAPVANKVEQVIIPKGTKVQSIPEEGQTPQIFETSEAIEARPEWNEMRPMVTKKQNIIESLSNEDKVLFFSGIDNQINIDDGLLISIPSETDEKFFVLVKNVDIDNERNITKVKIELMDPNDEEKIDGLMRNLRQSNKDGGESDGLSEDELENDVKNLKEYVNINNNKILNIRNQKPKPDASKIHIFRVHARIFGHNAPNFKIIKTSFPTNFFDDWDDQDGEIKITFEGNNTKIGFPYTNILVTKFDVEGTNGEPKININKNDYSATLYLDQKYVGITSDTYVLLYDSSFSSDSSDSSESSRKSYDHYKIDKLSEKTVSDFTLTGLVTKMDISVTLDNMDTLKKYERRSTSVYCKTEELLLSEIPINPIDESLEKNKIILDKMITGLNSGQYLIIKGEIIESNNKVKQSTGITKCEKIKIDKIDHVKIGYDDIYYTRIFLDRSLEFEYKLDTVVITANVCSATHGETIHEPIDFDSSSKQVLKYKLSKKPLVYTSTNSTTGVKSTLEIRVNDVIWHESNSLYGLQKDGKNYIIRQDEDQNSFVLFGGSGQKPSFTGESIEAKYRTGTGSEGLLKQNQLTVPVDRPLGLKGVTNPLPSKGGVDPEGIEVSRSNLSLPILTLERIVSLNDFENFAKAFTGIGKAKATKFALNNEELVLVTVAPSSHDLLYKQEDYKTLIESINLYKNYTSKFLVKACVKKIFNMEVKILISKGYHLDTVKDNVIKSLKKRYSFESMSISENIHSSMLIGSIESIEGVEAVDLNSLYIVNPDEPDFTVNLEDVLNLNTKKIYNFVKGKITKPPNLEWLQNIQNKTIKTDKFGNITEIILYSKPYNIDPTHRNSSLSEIREAIIYLDSRTGFYNLKIRSSRSLAGSNQEYAQDVLGDWPITLKQKSRFLIANNAKAVKQSNTDKFEILPAEILLINNATNGVLIEEMVLHDEL